MVVAAKAMEPAVMREDDAAEPGILTVSAPKLALHELTKFWVLYLGCDLPFSAPQ
ncbi:hypothetical protein BG004_006687, partial [Podila humilis]